MGSLILTFDLKTRLIERFLSKMWKAILLLIVAVIALNTVEGTYVTGYGYGYPYGYGGWGGYGGYGGWGGWGYGGWGGWGYGPHQPLGPFGGASVGNPVVMYGGPGYAQYKISI